MNTLPLPPILLKSQSPVFKFEILTPNKKEKNELNATQSQAGIDTMRWFSFITMYTKPPKKKKEILVQRKKNKKEIKFKEKEDDYF